MNKLPSEIQDIIFNHYWQFKFNNVLKELTKCCEVENKIKKFLYKYCFNDFFFQNKYLYYLLCFNKEIKSIVDNKCLKNICAINNLTLYHCYNESCKKNVCSFIDDKLKLITMFSISCSGQMRYFTLNRFHELSKVIT